LRLANLDLHLFFLAEFLGTATVVALSREQPGNVRRDGIGLISTLTMANIHIHACT
jgi:hypothetical protein